MSPSLMSTSRRSTLSRVNVLPTNSKRRKVNCFPSSIVTVKSTMPSFGFAGLSLKVGTGSAVYSINLSFHDRDRNAQSFVNRRQKRQRQDRETGATRTDSLDTRLAVSRLEIALRAHVVVDGAQVIFELLAVQNVGTLEARDEPGLFDVLHRAAQLAVTENLVAFELNLDDTNAVAFFNVKRDREGRR